MRVKGWNNWFTQWNATWFKKIKTPKLFGIVKTNERKIKGEVIEYHVFPKGSLVSLGKKDGEYYECFYNNLCQYVHEKDLKIIC